MKEKLKKKPFRGEYQLLSYALTGREQVDYELAEWLKAGPDALFLPFAYCGEAKGATFNYDLVGLVPLGQPLSAGISMLQYCSVLRNVHDVIAICVKEEIPTSKLVLSPERIFATEGLELRFVLAATKEPPTDGLGTPLSLLQWLGSTKNVKMVLEQDQDRVRAVGDWARRQRVFSPEDFLLFIDEEFSAGEASNWSANGSYAGASVGVGFGAGGGDRRGSIGAANVATSSAVNPLELLTGQSVKTTCTATEQVAAHVIEAASSGALASEPPRDVTGDTSSLGSMGSMATTACPISIGNVPSSMIAPSVEGVASTAQADDSSTPAGSIEPPTERQCRVYLLRERDGLRLEVPDAFCSLGRSAQCDLHFGGSPNVSRTHAYVRRDAGRLVVRDAGSSNGTFVRGQRLAPGQEVILAPGEELVLADEHFRVEEGRAL
jgi:hypothetical protein